MSHVRPPLKKFVHSEKKAMWPMESVASVACLGVKLMLLLGCGYIKVYLRIISRCIYTVWQLLLAFRNPFKVGRVWEDALGFHFMTVDASFLGTPHFK